MTASQQTAGRGRQGRTWVTPAGTAIAASLILRRFDDLLPLRAGVAVADLAGPAARVKWPNDVLVEGRKVAGILAEARAPDWAVLGIGVNVTSVPPEVDDIATALGRDDVEAALSDLLEALEHPARAPGRHAARRPPREGRAARTARALGRRRGDRSRHRRHRRPARRHLRRQAGAH